jgi:membrane protein
MASAAIWSGFSTHAVVRWFLGLAVLGPMAETGLSLGPFLLLTAAFVFMYLFLPNTSVPFWSALLAGLVAAGLWWGVQSLYIYFQVGVARYNAIYGGFALLPLFFVWVQVSWMVLLFGNELTHAHSLCRRGPLPRVVAPRLTLAQREDLGLRLMHLVALRFHQGEPPWSLTALATELDAPLRDIHRLAEDLSQAELLSRPDQDERVQPARSLATLRVEDVLAALRGEEAAAADPEPATADEAVGELLRRARSARREAVGGLTMLDLVSPLHCELTGKK